MSKRPVREETFKVRAKLNEAEERRLVETQYGFKWGTVEVERAVYHRGYKLMTLKTLRQELEITITPTGLITTQVTKRAKIKITRGGEDDGTANN